MIRLEHHNEIAGGALVVVDWSRAMTRKIEPQQSCCLDHLRICDLASMRPCAERTCRISLKVGDVLRESATADITLADEHEAIHLSEPISSLKPRTPKRRSLVNEASQKSAS
jgi:hypothetical protein